MSVGIAICCCSYHPQGVGDSLSYPTWTGQTYLYLLEPLPHHCWLSCEAVFSLEVLAPSVREPSWQWRRSDVRKPRGFVMDGEPGKLMGPVELDEQGDLLFPPCVPLGELGPCRLFVLLTFYIVPDILILLSSGCLSERSLKMLWAEINRYFWKLLVSM